MVQDLSVDINTAARTQVRRVGREGHPLLIIDDAVVDPWKLVSCAQTVEFSRPEHTLYPGLNAPLPRPYSEAVILALAPMLHRAFGLPIDRPLQYFGFFALATDPVERLVPSQKIPHQDSSDPFRIAMVHYLCEGHQGGTGFFRHKATGFESINKGRLRRYSAIADQEFSERESDFVDHVGDDTPGYELIDRADLVFNRLIVYRSHVLHSGLLRRETLSSDPAQGRLTANGFAFPGAPATVSG